MPAALRKKGKATQIAMSILGVPQNRSGAERKNKKQKQQEQRLNFEDTQRVR